MSLIIGFFVGLFFAAIARITLSRWSLAVIFLVLNVLYGWLSLPVLRYGFSDIPIMFLFNSIGLLAVLYLYRQSTKQKISIRKSRPVYILFAVSLLGVFLLPFLTSFAGFHAKKYYELAGDVPIGKFSEDVAAIDMSQVRRVDARLARNLADKRLGEDRGLGSRVSVGRMSIQAVSEQLYWVAPLNHSKFRRWWDNREGTPGYVMVSASNENDVNLVTEVGGKPLSLKYNMGAYFSHKPARYVYDNGFAFTGLTDWTFEIDDTGRPYYVITMFDKTIGFKGSNVVGVAILDVQNGDIKSYPITETPTWVDRIQPAPIVREQLTNWGRYKQGWVNSWLGADGVLQTTDGISLVYGNDGKSYFYTGMQSVGSDEGTVGFVLINTRTKEMRFYEQAGATETAARNSAEDEFQDFGYRSTDPILYNIGGVPTYFMTLKASSGLVKAAAFVSVEDYSIVGSGKTTEAALRSFNQALRGRGNAIALDGVENSQTLQGTVLRIQQEIIDQSVTYYFLFEENESRVFAVPSDISPEIRMTQIGDMVSLSYQDSGNAVIDAFKFDNKLLTLQQSETQEAINERLEVGSTE